jgi:hypothetical protein
LPGSTKVLATDIELTILKRVLLGKLIFAQLVKKAMQNKIKQMKVAYKIQLTSQFYAGNNSALEKGVFGTFLFLFTEHHAMKAYRGSGGIAPRILDLCTRWR